MFMGINVKFVMVSVASLINLFSTLSGSGSVGSSDASRASRSGQKIGTQKSSPEEVIERATFISSLPEDALTVVEFLIPGCGQCKWFAPVVNELHRLMQEDALSLAPTPSQAADTHLVDSNPSKSTSLRKGKRKKSRGSKTDERGVAGRFRGASLYVFPCLWDEVYCADLGINHVPVVRLYRGSQMVAEIVGARRLSELQTWLLDYISSVEPAHNDSEGEASSLVSAIEVSNPSDSLNT